MAGKIPPQFLKNIKGKKGSGKEDDEHEAMHGEMHGAGAAKPTKKGAMPMRKGMKH